MFGKTDILIPTNPIRAHARRGEECYAELSCDQVSSGHLPQAFLGELQKPAYSSYCTCGMHRPSLGRTSALDGRARSLGGLLLGIWG